MRSSEMKTRNLLTVIQINDPLSLASFHDLIVGDCFNAPYRTAISLTPCKIPNGLSTLTIPVK